MNSRVVRSKQVSLNTEELSQLAKTSTVKITSEEEKQIKKDVDASLIYQVMTTPSPVIPMADVINDQIAVTDSFLSQLIENSRIREASPLINNAYLAKQRMLAEKTGCASCTAKARMRTIITSLKKDLESASEFEIERIKKILQIKSLKFVRINKDPLIR